MPEFSPRSTLLHARALRAFKTISECRSEELFGRSSFEFSGRIERFEASVTAAMAASLAFAQVPAASLNGRVTAWHDS
jgi:hypothetical protein